MTTLILLYASTWLGGYTDCSSWEHRARFPGVFKKKSPVEMVIVQPCLHFQHWNRLQGGNSKSVPVACILSLMALVSVTVYNTQCISSTLVERLLLHSLMYLS